MVNRKIINRKDVLPFAAAVLVLALAAGVWLFKGLATRPASGAAALAPSISAKTLSDDEAHELQVRCRVIVAQRADDPLVQSYLYATCLRPAQGGGCPQRIGGMVSAFQDPRSASSQLLTTELASRGYKREQFGDSELNQARQVVQGICNATNDFAK